MQNNETSTVQPLRRLGTIKNDCRKEGKENYLFGQKRCINTDSTDQPGPVKPNFLYTEKVMLRSCSDDVVTGSLRLLLDKAIMGKVRKGFSKENIHNMALL